MKNFNLILILILLLVSCQKDDETFVPIQELPHDAVEQMLTDTSITLEWENANAPYYVVEYGTTGFNEGGGLQVRTSSTSITLTDLVPETTYDYYITAVFADRRVNIVRSIRGFTTRMAPVVTEFKQNLSEMRLFRGNLSDLTPSPYAFVYDLNTRLYTDYAEKQRIIAVPLGTSLVSNGDGLPDFPDKTVIAKTFYYNIDDRNLSLGKNLVETRVMIKTDGTWEFGNYIWNGAQTDATLDTEGMVTPISWIDMDGNTRNINYEIPSQENCFTCHQSFGNATPIGPKLRSMNFDIDGANQLASLIADGYLTGLTDESSIQALPDWSDTSVPEARRVRAYFDINCAHCHSIGGYHNENYAGNMRFDYETSFEDSHIYEQRYSIMTRIQTSIDGYSMPYLGVTTPHQEALDLIIPYLESME